jgi:hypothetical protein
MTSISIYLIGTNQLNDFLILQSHQILKHYLNPMQDLSLLKMQ